MTNTANKATLCTQGTCVTVYGQAAQFITTMVVLTTILVVSTLLVKAIK